MSERVSRDKAYYREYNKSHLETRPDIDIQWYFERVEDLERQLVEAQLRYAACSNEYRRVIADLTACRTNALAAAQERDALKAALGQVREAVAAGVVVVKSLIRWEGVPEGRRELGDTWLLDVAALEEGGRGMIDECPICDRELGIDEEDHVRRCLDKRIAAAVAEERRRILGEFLAWAEANEHHGPCAAMIRGIVGLLRARQP